MIGRSKVEPVRRWNADNRVVQIGIKYLNQQAFIQEKQAFVSGCRSDERIFAITLTELSNRTMQETGVA